MLVAGKVSPRPDAWTYENRHIVDLTPWHFAIPMAFTLFSAVVFLYLLFSKIGLVGGIGNLFWMILTGMFLINVLFWWRYLVTHRRMNGAG